MATTAASRQSGFTLLELLIYLALAASILAALASGTYIVKRGAVSITMAGDRMEMLDLGLQAFADDVARIERFTTGGPDTPRYLFTGAADQMVYVLADRPRPAASPLMLVRLSVHADRDGTALIRDRVPYEGTNIDPAAAPWTDTTTLIRGRFDMTFAYRGLREHDTGWTSQWSGTRRLPDQVRLSIRDRRTGKDVMPPLAVALMIDAEPRCNDIEDVSCTVRTAGELAWRKP